METLLARQLQQAWLETQVRKHASAASSSSPSNGSFSPSSSLQASSSSSPGSSDTGAGAGASSPSGQPTRQPNSDDEEPFHDPVLQVISGMLMDEDLEDRKCMYAECVSYMKELYDMIGTTEAPACGKTDSVGAIEDDLYAPPFACEGESSVVTEEGSYPDSGGLLGFSTAFDDASLDAAALREVPTSFPAPNHESNHHADIYAHAIDPSDSWITTEHCVSAPSNEPEKVLNVNASARDDDKWIDDLFSNMDAVTSAVLSPAASVNSYNRFSGVNVSSQSQSGSAYLYHEDPLMDSVSLSSSSVTDEAPRRFRGKYDSKLDNLTVLSNERYAAARSQARGGYGRSSSGNSQNLPQRYVSAGTSSRLKRAVTELDSVAVSQSVDYLSSASNSVMPDDLGEESVSFVQNEHLNAEKCASILNEGLSSVTGDCCKSSSRAVRESVGKPSIIVSTVADLKGLLMSCAQAVASNNLRRAQEILQEIRQDASPYGSGLQRMAHYFAEGLVARISGTGDRLYSVFTSNAPSAAKMLKAHQLFVEVCPFVKLSHYFANKAILNAAKGTSRLHIIDYGILYGLQWPCLISALAARKGGPPLLRITGIDFPQPGYAHAERVEMTGRRLTEYARTYGVPFEYHPRACRWETIEPSSLGLRRDEVIIVNSICRMQNLLDETVLASNPRKTVLNKIKEINPKIFVHGVKNGNYNAPFFMSRFKEALSCFSGVFDLLETLIQPDSQERMMMEREILGRDILNVVACEGPERIVRPETYRQWQNRAQKAGFVQLSPDRKLLSESQAIVKKWYNKNFTVDEDGSWMLLSWKGKVVDGLSLWKPTGNR